MFGIINPRKASLTNLSHFGALLMRTPLKNMLAMTVDNTVDMVIITIDRQKYAPETLNHVYCSEIFKHTMELFRKLSNGEYIHMLYAYFFISLSKTNCIGHL